MSGSRLTNGKAVAVTSARHPAPWPGCGSDGLTQSDGRRCCWHSRTATAPSPTAEATRFTESARTSPAANTPGRLVSRP